MLKPLGDRVVLEVQPAATEQMIGGIVIATGTETTSVIGTVVAVSTQDVGELKAPTTVEVGDQVIYDHLAAREVTYDGQEYLVLHEKDLVAVI